MKKVGFIILLTIAMRLSGYAQNLVGKWRTVVNKEEIVFVFDSLGYCAMQSEGQVMGGQMFLIDGKKHFMKYIINTQTKPFKLDMVLFDYYTKKEVRRMLAIYSFTDNKLNLCLDTSENKRPKEFKSSNDDCIKLSKVKD
ncbi:MAG: hypothetical protein V4643_11845 [Bacteroidota bacterium]